MDITTDITSTLDTLLDTALVENTSTMLPEEKIDPAPDSSIVGGDTSTLLEDKTLTTGASASDNISQSSAANPTLGGNSALDNSIAGGDTSTVLEDKTLTTDTSTSDNISQSSAANPTLVGDTTVQKEDLGITDTGIVDEDLGITDTGIVDDTNPSVNNSPVIDPLFTKLGYTAIENTAISFTIPGGTFTDADADPLAYTATLADGSPIPTWLTFDAATNTFSGTPTAQDVSATNLTIAVTANDGRGGTVTDSLFDLSIAPQGANSISPVLVPQYVPGISLASNLLTTSTEARGFGISAVSKKSSEKVNEIGMFAVDDINGKIGTLNRGDAGYMKAALDRSVSISTSLNGDFFSSDKQEIGLDQNKTYQFIKIEDGSLSDAKYQLDNGKTPANVVFLLPDADGKSPFAVTDNEKKDGYRVSINNDELVLNVTRLDGFSPNKPMGSKSQGSYEGRTIDLTDVAVGTKLTVSLTTKSDAAYNNQIGFYAVKDASGSIEVNGETILTTDPRYAGEAVKSAMANALQAGKNDSKTDLTIDSGKIFAPVVISQGTLESFSRDNPNNGGGANYVHAYFNYIGANSDKVDHFRLLGDNTFGVEDVYGGGDRDFNDLTIKMTVKA